MTKLGSRRKSSGNPLALSLSVILLFLVLHEVTPEGNSDLKFNSNDNDVVVSSNDEIPIKTNISSPPTISSSQLVYTCLPICECDYNITSLHLEIACSRHGFSSTANISTLDPIIKNQAATTSVKNLNLSSGVRKLILKHVRLNAASIPQLIPDLAKDTLAEVELHHVIIEPLALFNSKLFRNSRNSLRKVSAFYAITEHREIPPVDYRESLEAFANLKNLDSLTICDSNPDVSQIILQALPQVNHIQVFNSSLSQIYYLSFSHLTSLQSLNLSYNELDLIPNGLLDNLASLKYLDVSNNRITHLQEEVFAGLISLRKLNLSHNGIEYVDAEVFSHLEDLQIIDLSYNEVIQFFEPYFQHNNKLRVLKMTNAWVANTFINENTANRSNKEMDRLISTLRSVELLDIRDNQMMIIPETLSHVPKLIHAYIQGNPWECTCDDRWLLDWISTTNVSLGKQNDSDDLFCFSTSQRKRFPLLPYLQNLTANCNNSNIIARTPFKYYAIMGKDKVLSCHTRNPPWPKITWITPSKNHITTNANFTSIHQHDQSQSLNPIIYPDGALFIDKVAGEDYGLYICIASYEDLNITHYVHLGMDVSIFADVRLMSIIVGLISSFGFLILVLLAQAIRFLLLRSGLHCIAVRTANQARRVRTFFDSIQQHQNSQLDWLRQNYNMQARKIQDNCISQLERIRDSYTNQTKNLSEFRDYSAQQITTIRDNYQDQVRKVASYSAHRLGKVRENYVFNRNRVCKFSSHQLIRLREAYKWQAQTLNKILENLPQGLNLDACRGVGAGGRTDSVYLDDVSDFIGGGRSNLSSFKLGHGDPHEDKNEHISLLIPREFLVPYFTSSMEMGSLEASLLLNPRNTPTRSERIRMEMGDGDSHYEHFDLRKIPTDSDTTTSPSKSTSEPTPSSSGSSRTSEPTPSSSGSSRTSEPTPSSSGSSRTSEPTPSSSGSSNTSDPIPSSSGSSNNRV